MPGQCCTGDNEPCSAQVFIRLAAEMIFSGNEWKLPAPGVFNSSLTVSMQ